MPRKNSIFVDLDGVIVKSFSKKDAQDNPDFFNSFEDVVTTYNGVVSVLRPGSREFLQEIDKLGSVYLFTAAQLSYAKSLIKAFDIGRHFSKFYTTVYHTHNSISCELNLNGTPWVIIEDSPVSLAITQYKLGSLGITKEELENKSLLDRHYIEVKPYEPHKFDNGGRLDQYVDVVKDKIRNLEKRLILF